MRLLIPILAGALLLGGCQPAQVRVDGAWIRLPAVAGRPGAAYFHIRGGDQTATVVGVATPLADRAELHESMAGGGGMMTMAPLAKVDVPPRADIAFAPAGRHVMLFGLSPAAKAGGTGRLSVRFADGRTISTEARILAAGDPAPTG